MLSIVEASRSEVEATFQKQPLSLSLIKTIQMSLLRKAYTSDFELVYPLLKQFEATGMSKERWQLLFNKYWLTTEDHIGYLLIDNNIAVGFIGCVFSIREIDGESHNFCGLSSWIVNPDYRSESILLFSEVLRLKKHTITSFTSIPEAAEILKKMKFKTLDSNYFWFPRKLNSLFFTQSISTISDVSKIHNHLNSDDLKIFNDHLQFKAVHIVFVDKSEYCYIIFKKQSFFRRKLMDVKFIYYLNRISKLFCKKPYLDTEVITAKIHYISNIEMFNRNISAIVKKLSLDFETNGVIIDSRFYKKKSRSIKFKSYPQTSLYKSSTLNPIQIDSLYTELFILDY